MGKKQVKIIDSRFKLNLSDLFNFSKVLKDFGETEDIIKQALKLTEEGKNANEVGMSIFCKLIEGLPKVENSLPVFLKRFTEKEVMELDLDDIQTILKMIFNNNDVMDFFSKAAQ